jgi:hypothetical protein
MLMNKILLEGALEVQLEDVTILKDFLAKFIL